MLEKVPARYCLLVLLALIVTNTWLYRALSAPKTLEISVLAVGKGDATLVRSPSGKTLLVDTGPDASILRALGTTLPEWHRSIDAIILTSASTKSTGGMPNIQSRYTIGKVTSLGNRDIPYGSTLIFDTNTFVTITAPGTFSVSYGASYLPVSSTTPTGTCVSDGAIFTKQ